MSEYGSITMQPHDDVVAGSKVTLTFTYTAGSLGVRRGGSLRIATPNDAWEWPCVPMHRYFQAGHERGGYDDGYCSYARRSVSATVETAGEAWIDLSAEERHCAAPLKGPWAHHIVATVRRADLADGDVIEVVYGDRTWGEDGIEVQRVAPTDKDHFHAYIDISGEREFVELPADELKIRVLPGLAFQWGVVGPAIVRPGEAFTLRISAMDEFRNRPREPFEGDLRVSVSKPQIALGGSVSFAREDANHVSIDGIRAVEEGVYRIAVEPAAGGDRSVGNPIWCTGRDLNLYFGDLHCQSTWHSDSIGTPDEGYEYGRDIAGLDFMGITDSGGCYREGWQDTQEAANRHYEPGRFVALKGFEYGASLGHRNVIYRACEVEPTLNDLPRSNPTALFECFRGRDDVLIIPHHTKVWTDWNYHDPDLEPIVEAYSCWGSGVEHNDPLWHKSEKPGAGVFAALARGYRFGFIGSGDSHAGLPGRSYPQDRQWCVHQKSGLACVYAPELTREAIFDALRQRRCYATTGARMILEFSVNDVPMGEVLRIDDVDEPRITRVHVIGTGRLSWLKLVKNNDDLVQRELTGDEAFFEYHDTTPARDGDFYYVRGVQEDENTAWSSPVWVAAGDR